MKNWLIKGLIALAVIAGLHVAINAARRPETKIVVSKPEPITEWKGFIPFKNVIGTEPKGPMQRP